MKQGKSISLFTYVSSEKEIDIALKVIKHCISVFDFEDVILVSKIDDFDSSNFEELGCRIVEDDLDSSYQSYNFFMVNRLANHIKTDFVLTVQSDGFIINPSCWLDENLKYDYIGAPWFQTARPSIIGNGGFSFRSKKLLEACQKISTNVNPESVGNEDSYICKNIKNELEKDFGINFAPVELAAKFSVEWNACPEQKHIDMHKLSTYDTFGFHGISHVPLMHATFLNKEKTLKNSYEKYKVNSDSGGGDKGTVHDYIGFYSEYVKPEKCQNLLEIGVHKGYSIKMWEDFLPDCNIVGLDINLSQVEFEFSNANLFQVNATSNEVLNLIGDKSFDVIIDDGSHRIQDQIKTFEILYPRLNQGGFYFIEDIVSGNNEKQLLSFLNQLSLQYRLFRPIEKSGRYDDIIIVVFK